MNTNLDHLSDLKQRELAHVVEVLFAEFEDALKGRNAPHRKQGRILKIVLFGSYARGDWVDDPKSGYRSDYDLLVVVNHDELADVMEYWREAEEHLLRDYEISRRISAPANFIVHSFRDVNQQLKLGRPFFIDIARDGVALYEAPGYAFEKPMELSEQERHSEARGYLEKWLRSSVAFISMADHARGEGNRNEAAFALHQATERLYHCVLLVLTLYSPKSHKLNFLRSQAERLAPTLIAAWPRETRFEQRAWDLLRRAYVDGRYSPHYKISSEELQWLAERITILRNAVEAVCRERLTSFQV